MCGPCHILLREKEVKTLSTADLIQVLSNRVAMDALRSSWPRWACAECKLAPATGVYLYIFTEHRSLKLVCAGCGMSDSYKKYTGFMSAKLDSTICVLPIESPELYKMPSHVIRSNFDGDAVYTLSDRG